MKSRGFTLVELLVVISIIGFLSSVVFASLQSARMKARDAAIISQVNQYRLILEQNYDRYGDYSAVSSRFWYKLSATNCDTSFSGDYAIEARKLCNKIVDLASQNNSSNSNFLLLTGDSIPAGDPPVYTYNNQKYSINAYLPGRNLFYCVGSSGITYSVWDANWPNRVGCYYNP